MKIGILVSMINNFGEKGFYNSQEIGMAKALASMGNNVIVYKLLKTASEVPDNIKTTQMEIYYSTVKAIGINGIVDTRILDKTLDVLVFFSDTQLVLPRIFKWCKFNKVKLIPYIGVIESHSPNRYKRVIMNSLFMRNMRVYKKCKCLVKNIDVKKRLEEKGVNSTDVAPVGIDTDLLNYNYRNVDLQKLKMKYGYKVTDKVILFVGRLEEEKRPIDLIQIFNMLYKKDSAYKLLIVGKGVLYQPMLEEIQRLDLSDEVKYIDKIPNNQIWELYRISEAFVNLNKQEIFGMVLMEAMFYETKLVAFHAPGPDYIVENEVSGILVDTDEEMVQAIMRNYPNMGEKAHSRVIKYLTWETTAKKIIEIAEEK